MPIIMPVVGLLLVFPLLLPTVGLLLSCLSLHVNPWAPEYAIVAYVQNPELHMGREEHFILASVRRDGAGLRRRALRCRAVGRKGATAAK